MQHRLDQVASFKRELDEVLEQQKATAEVLRVISSPPALWLRCHGRRFFMAWPAALDLPAPDKFLSAQSRIAARRADQAIGHMNAPRACVARASRDANEGHGGVGY